MPDQVPVQVARERNRVLRELGLRKKHEFMSSFVGRELEGITLTRYDGQYTEALTDNYLKLFVAAKLRANQMIRARVCGVENEALISEPQPL